MTWPEFKLQAAARMQRLQAMAEHATMRGELELGAELVAARHDIRGLVTKLEEAYQRVAALEQDAAAKGKGKGKARRKGLGRKGNHAP